MGKNGLGREKGSGFYLPEISAAERLSTVEWNLQRNFIGHDGTDYLEGMKTLCMPVMAIAAESDRTIAPPQGCQNYLAVFGSHRKRFVLEGPEYGHTSVMQSRAARSEIWPIVRAWLFDDDTGKEAYPPS